MRRLSRAPWRDRADGPHSPLSVDAKINTTILERAVPDAGPTIAGRDPARQPVGKADEQRCRSGHASA